MSKSLTDYLDLTMDQAVSQWLRILAREPTEGRQETYLPVEVLLAYSLFFVVSPSRYGGANIHKAPAVVHQIAALTKRSAGSITYKMLNLDGSRSNAGQFEWRVFMALSGATDHHAHLYTTVIAAARHCGVTEVDLPDFLHRLGADHIELVGQDEIDASVLQRESATVAEEMQVRLRATIAQTTRVAEYRARVGQHRFANDVLHNCGHQCVFCGFSAAQLPNQRLLVASHIKPWSKSSDRERLDVRNGVAACPTHDAAFDSGLLTINGGLRIHRAPRLDAALSIDPSTRRLFGSPTLSETAILPRGATTPGPRYLKFHKTEVFQSSS